MMLHLQQFETFPAHVLLRGEPGEIRPDYEGLVDVKSVSLELDIQKPGEEYFCRGEVVAQVQLECARCLDAFERELVNQTDFIICDRESFDARAEEAIDDEDYAFFEGSNLTVDLSVIVQQTILLAISMKPLCSDDCRGLCPECGANLNITSCRCQAEQTDPRWDALKRSTDNKQMSKD
jgi:uncharacterized protein